jgi:hypothetical protein
MHEPHSQTSETLRPDEVLNKKTILAMEKNRQTGEQPPEPVLQAIAAAGGLPDCFKSYNTVCRRQSEKSSMNKSRTSWYDY